MHSALTKRICAGVLHDALSSSGLPTTTHSASVGEGGFENAFQRTLDAMREGVDVIYQSTLRLTPEPYDSDTQKAAGVVELGERHVLIKRGLRSTAPHPRALVTGKPIDSKPLPDSLQAVARAVLAGAAGHEAAESSSRRIARAP